MTEASRSTTSGRYHRLARGPLLAVLLAFGGCQAPSDGPSFPGESRLAEWWIGEAVGWYSGMLNEQKNLRVLLFESDGTFTYRHVLCGGADPGFSLDWGRWRVSQGGARVDLFDSDGLAPYPLDGAMLGDDISVFLTRSSTSDPGSCELTLHQGVPYPGETLEIPLIRGELCVVEPDACGAGGWGEWVYYCDLTPPATPELQPCPEP